MNRRWVHSPKEHFEVAIVHDYLTQRGGAERVVLSMLRAFPGAPLFTSVYEPLATFPEFGNHDIRTLWTNHIAGLRQHHRRGLLLFPMAFSNLHVDAEVVLCSSSGYAHGAKTTGRKVVYCYTPPRWLYDQADTYLRTSSAGVAAVVKAAGPMLRRWDGHAAATADSYLTSSSVVRERIRAIYGLNAIVLPPPIPQSLHGALRVVPRMEPGFVLCVSRLMAYKNVDAICEAFEELPAARLVVVGEGPETARMVESIAPNVTLTGPVDDDQLRWLYANCVGVVSASYEDFGLTAIEAASCGKPVAVLRWGGFLDTVVEGTTGVFFESPAGRDIADAVQQLCGIGWDTAAIKKWASQFSEDSFTRRLKDAVARS